jgi:DNA-binding transcriptional regulator YiaG
MSNSKNQPIFTDQRFGFPVQIVNAPTRLAFGEVVLDINANVLRAAVLATLAARPEALAGAHVRFIRRTLNMSMQQLAEQIGVSHAAVSKWEKHQDEPTEMNVAAEKLIRQFALSAIPAQWRLSLAGQADSFETVKSLIVDRLNSPPPVLDGQKLAQAA